MDVKYAMQRYALIPKAEKIANHAAGPEPRLTTGFVAVQNSEWLAWAAKWNRAFHTAMEDLWRAKQGK